MKSETVKTEEIPCPPVRGLVLLFAAGLAACLFSNGRFNIPVLAWVWPVCLLAVSRSIQSRRLWAAGGVTFWVVQTLRFWGFTGGGLLADFLSGLLVGLIILLPFLLDRLVYGWLRERIGGLAILFFPCALTALNVLSDLLISANRLGYTQTDNLPLMQAAAVVGSHGLTFLVACFATALLYAVESCGKGRRAFVPLCIYGAVMLIIMVVGGARLTFFQSTGDFTMTVASVLTPAEGDFLTGSLETLTKEENLAFLEEMACEAKAGNADLLCTGEEAFELDDTELSDFLALASAVAREQSLWMLLGFDVQNTDGSNGGRKQNKTVLLDQTGAVVGEYTKTCLIPAERLEYVAGDGEMLYAEIPLENGKTVHISSVICFDCNNSAYISGIDDRTDVLVVPSWCWDGCDLYQAAMQRFRAVENGVSLVSSTIDAKSLVVDYQGNVMSATDEDSRGRTSLSFSYVPVQEESAKTVYHYIAPYFDWIYLLGAAALLGAAGLKRRTPSGTGAAM